jgi:hypothetical protein
MATAAPLQPEDCSDSELELRHRGLWRGSTGSLVSMPSMTSARLDDVEYMQWRVRHTIVRVCHAA